MTIRDIVRGLIIVETDLTDEIDSDFWLSSSAITSNNRPASTPFAVLRYGVATRGMAHIRRIPLEIWLHDEPGSYGTIDSLIALLRGTLDGVVHQQDSNGNELMSADWVSDSGDLFDPGFRTIVKTTSYNLVGKGV